jgi:hypothetical protein
LTGCLLGLLAFLLVGKREQPFRESRMRAAASSAVLWIAASSRSVFNNSVISAAPNDRCRPAPSCGA